MGAGSAIWRGSQRTTDSYLIGLSVTSDDRPLLKTESR